MITLPSKGTELHKVEAGREYDISGASLEGIHNAFFRPFTIRCKDAE